MSWFDDAPAPMVAPALKGKPAAARCHPRRTAVSDEAIARWTGLLCRAPSAIAPAARCARAAAAPSAVAPDGWHRRHQWLLHRAQDEAAAELVSGDAGQLLHNMLKAIELDRLAMSI
jgi:DNA polymerase